MIVIYYSWRITKYNPSFRDERGYYKQEEWTSIHDIGNEIDGKIISIEEYQNTEQKYVSAIFDFLDFLDIPYLKVVELEKHSKTLETDKFTNLYPREMNILYSKLKEGIILSSENIMLLSKLILRNELWCKLEYEDKLFVHFGYDYYMYIVSKENCLQVINRIIESGLFVEPFVSPYLEN